MSVEGSRCPLPLPVRYHPSLTTRYLSLPLDFSGTRLDLDLRHKELHLHFQTLPLHIPYLVFNVCQGRFAGEAVWTGLDPRFFNLLAKEV